jgi:transposase
MRKLKEVLRLHSLGLSQHQIARSCSISQSTVHEYLSAAQAAGVKWPAPEHWDDQQIERALFPQRPAPAIWRKHPEPDWTQIHQELQTHKDLTLQLVWQEGRESNPDGYGYSRFCDLYRRWLKKLDLVLRQEHRAGEKMFVDYAGATIPIHNPESGEVASRRRVRGGVGRQQLHLRRSHHRAGSAELDRFAYAGLGVFRWCGRGRSPR